MGNVNKYELIVKSKTGGSGEYDDIFPEDAENKKGGFSFKKLYKSVSRVWASAELVRNIFGYELSRVGVRTGNNYRQDQIDFWTGLAKQGGAVIGSFALGGPVAGTAALLSVGISYLHKADQYHYSREWEGVYLQQQRLRAGPSLNRSRR